MTTITATILDGNKIATEIRSEVAQEVKALAATGVRPGLAVILAGNDPASEIYVRNKVKASAELGIHSEKLTPPGSVTTEELLGMVAELNRRDDIDGILVQLPLPTQVDAKRVLVAVAPEKDVDGLHPVNVGNLSTQRPGLVPCTPAGVMEILKRSNIPIRGQHAVVIGRSEAKPAMTSALRPVCFASRSQSAQSIAFLAAPGGVAASSLSRAPLAITAALSARAWASMLASDSP